MANIKIYNGTEWVDIGSGGGGGTTNYNDLDNRPQIGGVTLSGNKTAAALGLAPASHTHVKADITDLPDISGFNAVELWSHSPTTQIDGNSPLTIDMSAYEWFIVEFATNTAAQPSGYRQSILVRKGFYNKCTILYSTYLYWRMVYIYNDGVSFTNGNRTAISNGANTEGAGYCIPVKIYGIK